MFEGRVARIHRQGDPLRYSWGDEHRDATELARIAAQLPGKPVITHPQAIGQHPDELLREGAPARTIGRVESARVDGEYVVARIFLTDADPAAGGADTDTHAAIRSGMRELSLGYACRADATGHQRGTEVDHLTVLPRGRCGGTCALRADSGAGAACGCTGALAEVQDSRQCCDTCKPHSSAPHSPGNVSDPHADSKLNAAERHALSPHSFGIPGREGLPLEDASHVRDAMARFGQEHFKDSAERKAAYHRVIARAHELGIDSTHFAAEHGRMDATPAPATSPAPVKDNVMDEIQKQLATTQAALTASVARADAAELAAKTEKSRADALEAERDNARADAKTEKSRADAAEQAKTAAEDKSRQDAANALAGAVRERVALETTANGILGAADKDGKAIDRSAMSDRDIKCAVVKHVDGMDIATEKSADYVAAMFDGARERHAKAGASRDAAKVVINTPALRQDGAPATPATTAADTIEASMQTMRDGFSNKKNR